MNKDTRISPHFLRSEFACRCGCGFAAADTELCCVLEECRFFFASENVGEAVGIQIDDACRCKVHNEKVKGAPRSQHINGLAADIKVWRRWKEQQIPPDIVAAYFERAYPDKYGVGRYDTFTHIDVRPARARWDLRTPPKIGA